MSQQTPHSSSFKILIKISITAGGRVVLFTIVIFASQIVTGRPSKTRHPSIIRLFATVGIASNDALASKAN